MSEFTFIRFTCFQPIISACQDIFESRFCHPFLLTIPWLCVNCRFPCVFCSASSRLLMQDKVEGWSSGWRCLLAGTWSPAAVCVAPRSLGISEALRDIFLELPQIPHCQRRTPSPPRSQSLSLQDRIRTWLILAELRQLLGFLLPFQCIFTLWNLPGIVTKLTSLLLPGF